MKKKPKPKPKKKIQKRKIESIDIEKWNPSELLQVLGSMRGKKILVIGDIGVDRYTMGIVERISPEAPVPIVLVHDEKLKLGLAANVADNVQALGGIPYLVGVLGTDRGADDFKILLQAAEIKNDFLVEDRDRRTIVKERVVSDYQQLVRIDYESPGAIHKDTQKKILKIIKSLLPEIDGVVVEDYCKGLVDRKFLKVIFENASRVGKFVAVDPNSKTPIDYYQGAWLLTPNTKEAESLSGVKIRDHETLVQAGRMILNKTLARHVVITRGKEGMAIFSKRDSLVKLIPTFAREVYDVSGAGDTVISVLALALAGGAPIEQAAILGNLAAGIEVGKRGTATVSSEELQLLLEGTH